MDEPTKKPKHRGTIIVDTCLLLNLESPISARIREKQTGTGHYYDILPFLAQHGFTIIIPEAVMYETTSQLLVDGELKGIFSYFPKKSGDEGWKRREGLLHTELQRFFLDVQRGKYPNISIQPCETFPDLAAEYINELKSLVRKFPEPSSRTKDEIRKLQAAKPDQLGDRIIAHQIQHVRERAPDEAVYILSDDIRMVHDLSARFGENAKNIHITNSLGLLYALTDHKLQRILGIYSGTHPRTIKSKLVGEGKRLGSSFRLPASPVDAHVHNFGNEDGNDPNQWPMSLVMKDIALELPKEQRVADLPEVATERQIDKFRKRYAKILFNNNNPLPPH